MNLSKSNLELCGLTMIMTVELYKNREQSISSSANKMSKKMTDFYNIIDNKLLDKSTFELAKISTEYAIVTSIITNLFHTFEQYIKLEYKLNSGGKDSFMKKLEYKCMKYDYDTKENTYYDSVEKFRKLNNSIKHGKIKSDFKNEFPNFINTDDDLGTLLDNSLNITENDIEECFASLFGFISEMYTYFEDMGYIEEEV